ncbi:MAG TPA: GNAT family N-acetyltransferase [Anaerolineales bacterium]|nr:GNAT family N-acetyltransferase [Anaerolineales bacterium]
MPIDIVRDQATFSRMGAEWNRLLSTGVTDVPFLRHEYLALWWSTLGGGEWAEGDLCVVEATDDRGRLTGIAPLFRTPTPEGAFSLRWIGSREISDYLDLIVAPADHEAFVEAMLDRLEGEAWSVLELDNVLEDSPTLPVVEAAARKRGWPVTRTRTKPCPLARLEGGWEGYLARLDKKQRHELRRKMRRAQSHPSGIEVRHIREAGRLEMEIEGLLGLMALDSAKAEFLSPTMKEHFRGLARTGGREGWLQLSFLLAGGGPAAGYLSFVYRNRLWIYNSGMDPSHLSLSPGWVLLGHMIQDAAEAGMEAVDFLRGEETYKTQLGGVPRTIEQLVVRR